MYSSSNIQKCISFFSLFCSSGWLWLTKQNIKFSVRVNSKGNDMAYRNIGRMQYYTTFEMEMLNRRYRTFYTNICACVVVCVDQWREWEEENEIKIKRSKTKYRSFLFQLELRCVKWQRNGRELRHDDGEKIWVLALALVLGLEMKCAE